MTVCDLVLINMTLEKYLIYIVDLIIPSDVYGWDEIHNSFPPASSVVLHRVDRVQLRDSPREREEGRDLGW